MLFDKLCGIAENHLKQIIPTLRDARIFDFPYIPHEVLEHEPSMDDVNQLRDRFFLPFPVVAIEDKASCVVIWDSIENQEGCGDVRYFAECLPYVIKDSSAFDLTTDGQAKEAMHKQLVGAASKIKDADEAVVVVVGKINKLESATRTKFGWSGSVGLAFVATKDRIMVSSDTLRTAAGAAGWDAVNEMSIRNASVAVQEILMMNSPDRFILERTTEGVRKAQKKNSSLLRRSHERPTYTLLTPTQIRSKISVAQNQTGPIVEGHERRRHFRTLKSDRFVNAQGKILTIPATWVGPHEVTTGKTHYRVCLEM